MGNVYMQKLQQSTAVKGKTIEIEEVVNGAVHLITKEVITKYKILISEPLLQDDWMKGMCTELEGLSQGYGEKGTKDYVNGTHTVLFMDL